LGGGESGLTREEASGSAIEIVGLKRSFGPLVAVDGVDLSVHRGELFSLLGPNGAGKTTTIRMLCCLLRPTDGTARIGGFDIREDPMAVKQIIGVSPQETAIAEHLNAWENLSLMARLHGLSEEETKRRSEGLLEMLGLTDRATERVKKFSGGMKRRLSIGMALVSDPDVLFLDEPTLGLDPQSRRGLWEHIEELKGDTTIVLTTHYLEEADALADRIGVIDEGRVVALGTAAELKSSVPGAAVTVVEADLTDEAVEALRRVFANVRLRDGGAEIEAAEVSLDSVVDVLRPLGIAVRSTYRKQVTLDDVFLHLTGKQLRE
jgi:ABC-2 type transport system ATP-binding protein